jgi:hypothetical protein
LVEVGNVKRDLANLTELLDNMRQLQQKVSV